MTVAMRLTAGAMANGRSYTLLSKAADAVALIANGAQGTTVHTFPANQTVRRPEVVMILGIKSSVAVPGLVLGSSPWKTVIDPITVTVNWFNATGGGLTPDASTAVDVLVIGTS